MRRRRRRERPESALQAAGPVLLASEGRPIPPESVELAASLADGGIVHVLSVTRIWGTGLGLPMPGLLPNRAEWEAQRGIVGDAVRALEERGIDARGHVIATRRAGKEIVKAAGKLGCRAIVMGADAPRNRLAADFMWSQEPYRVRRRAKLPVHLVVPGDESG